MMWLAVAMVVPPVLCGAGVWWARRRLLLVEVVGMSMEPALRDGDVVLAARRGRVAAGRVVVVARHYEGGLGWDIKRVESVRFEGLFLVGDNLNASKDSRDVGLYDRDGVLGVAIVRVWRRKAIMDTDACPRAVSDVARLPLDQFHGRLNVRAERPKVEPG
jgi:Peptidase S24-like